MPLSLDEMVPTMGLGSVPHPPATHLVLRSFHLLAEVHCFPILAGPFLGRPFLSIHWDLVPVVVVPLLGAILLAIPPLFLHPILGTIDFPLVVECLHRQARKHGD